MLPLLYAVLGTGLTVLLNDLVQQYRRRISRGEKLRIQMSVSQIKNQEPRKLIKCEGRMGTSRAFYWVSCGHWENLKLSEAEKQAGSFNLMDHIADLVAKPTPEQPSIGLITFQNGISNTEKDFEDKIKSILQNLPVKSFFIGMFNPTDGKALGPLSALADLKRLLESWISHPDTTICTWRMMATIAEQLPSDPRLFWLHIAHSEGGLLANLAITEQTNTDKQKAVFNNQLLTLTYGAVLPIAKRNVKISINTYSETDIAKPSPGKFPSSLYDIRIVTQESTISLRQRLIEGDHDFLGDTYTKRLKNHIDDIKSKFNLNAK